MIFVLPLRMGRRLKCKSPAANMPVGDIRAYNF